MKEQLIGFKTAKLAKEKGFDLQSLDCYNERGYLYSNGWCEKVDDHFEETFSNTELDRVFLSYYTAPTQSLIQRFIRENRGVHIEIHRNASGYYWSMCKSDGGTDLGWSDHTGPNLGGVWDKFEDALENALQVQLSYDLPNDTKIIKHWGNYVESALKSK